MRISGWQSLPVELFPWASSFNRIALNAGLPMLSGRTLYITSDYSGEGKTHPYDVISILIADLDQSKLWEVVRRRVRQDYLPDGRRMAFKSLNDRKRKRALLPFLEAANHITGVCLTIAIHKQIKNLCSGAELLSTYGEELQLKAVWHPRAFEKMLRIVNFVALLVGGLSHHGQHVYWISDQDAMLGNSRRASDVGELLSRMTGQYVRHQLGELGVGTTALDEGDRLEEDFAAIPDLAAGAISEIVTSLNRSTRGRFTLGLAHPLNPSLSTKCSQLAEWLGDEGHALYRLNLIFDLHPDRRYSLGRFRIE